MSKYLPDIRQGDEYTICIDMSDSDSLVPVPTDLTGYKAWFTLKTDLDDVDPTLEYSVTAGENTGDSPAGGIMYIVIPSAVTMKLCPGMYVFDIQIKRPGPAGEGIKTLLPMPGVSYDIIQVHPQVSRAVS